MARTIRVAGEAFPTATEAVQETHAGGRGVAIAVGGTYLVVDQAEADRLAAARVRFSYLSDREGRLMAVPVND